MFGQQIDQKAELAKEVAGALRGLAVNQLEHTTLKLLLSPVENMRSEINALEEAVELYGVTIADICPSLKKKAQLYKSFRGQAKASSGQ